jgi:protein-disulfide isomerase
MGDEVKPASPKEVAAVVDGQVITIADVDRTVGPRMLALRSQEYTLRRRALDDEIDRRLLEAEATRRHVTVQELLSASMDGVTSQSSPAPTGARGEAQSQRRAALVKSLREKAGVRIQIEPPRLKVRSDGGPSRGAATAPITIVEFSDFQCPYCARVKPTLRQLEDRFPGKIRLVFRDFPLQMHRQAAKAAEAAACANEQGRFWEMHDRLFAQQNRLDVPNLKVLAAHIGLDQARFDECLDSGKNETQWRNAIAEATQYGVTGTPAFFVNGRFISGAASLEQFVSIVDEELDRLSHGSRDLPRKYASPQ